MRDSAALARAAYAQVLHEPVPERLLAAASGHRVRETHRPRAFADLLASWQGVAPAAAAALVFAVLGGGGGGLAAGVMDGREQAQALAMRAEEQRMMAQIRQTALETKVSGESVEWRTQTAAR